MNRGSVMPGPDALVRAGEARARAESIVTWLLEEERLRAARTTALLDRFVQRLLEAGLPLDRASLHIQQLHPQLAARSILWDSETGGAVEMGYEHSVRNRDAFLASPVKVIYEGGAPIRRHLEDPACPIDFPILAELTERACTDYAIFPMLFSGGATNAISVATRRAGGFHDLDTAILDEVLPAFAAVLELAQLRRTARELLSTYVGPNTGERILSGAVKRGDGEVIHAVLWYCDLRGFTALSQTEPLGDVIALLNEYFDGVARPVAAHGGEVLKFIGDAMLAIFPCEATAAAVCSACDAAVTAAEVAVASVAALNRARTARGKAPVHCGVAVHVGDVMYGNVGAADRLDFTVIGPAVNLVNRLEHLCAELDHPIVISADVARGARRRFRPLGRHALKDIAEPQEVFTLADGPVVV
ncbi:MAG: adenylate/guanylate cyclase domain-containing protein [Kiloniellaceae bacterium]